MIYPDLLSEVYVSHKLHFYKKNQTLQKAFLIKFIYSEKATKFYEISTLLLSKVHTDKSKVEISQNFVAFSEYMNFTKLCSTRR